MTSTLLLDSFQLIVAIYLFYVAIKGEGQMYRFFDLSEKERPRVHKILRTCYFVCAFLALADAGVNMLQNTMFTQTISQNEILITQHFRLDAFPFITYQLLSVISAVLTVLIIVGLVGVLIYVRRRCPRGEDRGT